MKETIQQFSSATWRSLEAYWTQFLAALPRIVFALLLLVFIIFIASRISRFLQQQLSGKAHDPLFSRFVAKLIKITLLIVGLILFLHVLGLSGIASGLLAGAGVSALVFGFAFKDIGENFLAGIILAFNRPFQLNDTIKIDEHVGRVQALNFRTTHIKTFDEKDVFLPNATVIKQTLVNLTQDGMIRLDFVVGIAYEDNIDDAIKSILSAVKTVPDLLREKEPFAAVEELATSTVNIRVFFWTSSEDYKKGVLLTKSRVMTAVKNRLTTDGFTLPADIQELKLYDKRETFPISIRDERK